MCVDIELIDVFEKADNINVYNDNVIKNYSLETNQFKIILDSFKTMICDAHEMPAYGVSINRLTQKEMEKGLWVEFCFNTRYQCNGMPFDKLLVCVKSEYCGFNVIRYMKEYGYDGRCFYYDLVDKNMSEFNAVLRNI